MTPERHNQLMEDMTLRLTAEEMKAGWHFCPDWDGLLMPIDDETCPCDPWTEEEITEALK